MFPKQRAAAEQAFQGPEPEQLIDVEDLAGVTAEDPVEVEVRQEAETIVKNRYSEAPLSPDAFDAAVEVEVDIIRNRATAASTPPTSETDLVERAESEELQELLDQEAAETRQIERMLAADRNQAISDFEEQRTEIDRTEVLDAVLAEEDVLTSADVEKRFSEELVKRGKIYKAQDKPTMTEIAAAVERKGGVRPQIKPEVVEREVVADGSGVTDIEAVIPEKGDKAARREQVRAQTETSETVETLITPEFFDTLGIPKSAPIRKRKALQGKDVSSPEVQEALQTLITSYSGQIKKAEDRGSNPKAARQVRANLLNYRALGKVVPPSVKPPPAATDTRTSLTDVPQPPMSTVALPTTDSEKLLNLKGKALPSRGKYTPRASVSYYMQNTVDEDQALRAIAFEGTFPLSLDKVSPKDVANKEIRRADAATKWVQDNLSTEASVKLTEYKTFYESQERRGDAFLEKLTAEQDARENLDAEYIEKDNQQDDALTKEALQAMDVYGSNLEDAAGVIDYLRSDAVAATMPLVSESVNNKVLDNDLKGALEQLAADAPNAKVRNTAIALSLAIKDINVEFVDGLASPSGVKSAGTYIASQNLIQIDLTQPLNSHTLLHEAAHAVTSTTLYNQSHPVTKQLLRLFNEVKGKLPEGSYGKESLQDFVAEAYTNPEFRATLASYKPAGSKLTAWQRFTNAVKSLFGLPTTPVQNMEEETVEYINMLVAEAIDTRDATTVPQALANNDAARAVYKLIAGGTALAPVKTLKDARDHIWGRAEQYSDTGRMTLINAMTLDNLVDLVKANPELKPFYEATRDFQEVIKQQDGDRNERIKDFGNKLNDFKATFKGDSKAIEIFNELVGRSTIEEVDPTKPSSRYERFGYSYTDKNGKAVEKVIYNTATERDEAVDALDRTVVRAGVRKLNTTPERVAEYKKVKKLYESLTPKQQTTYRGIRDMYKKMNEEILESIDAKLDDLNLESAVKETVKEKAFRKILNSGVIDPYFKLDRTGDYWIEFEYKTPDGRTDYGVSAHVTPGARKIARRNLENNPNVDSDSIREKPRPDITAESVNVPTGFLVQLLDSLKQPVTITDIDAAGNKTEREVKIPQQAIDLVNDVLLKSLPEQGLVQGHKQRKGLAGYETNALKTFEDSFPRLINSFTNLSYEVKLTNAANKVREGAALSENISNRDRNWVNDISNALVGTRAETNRQVGKLPSYLEFVKNPNLPNWARRLRSSSFIYTLGFNISSAAVNMSTLPMIVGPLLSGKFGGVKATSAMSRAIKMYTQSFGNVTREGVTEDGEIGDVSEFGGFSYTNKEGGPLKFLIERLQEIGLDTRTIASENADYENPAAPFLNKLAYVSSFIFNHSERAIRQVTAASSYILEVEKAYAEANKGKPAIKIADMSEADIAQFGPEAAKVATEFMEYANSSALLATAPRWAQTGPGAILYQFKRFPAQVLYIQLRMLKAMTRQARGVARTPEQIEEDRALRSAFVYMTATGGAMVGAKGLPFYGMVALVADMFLDEDEDDTNTIVAKTVGDGWYYGMLAKYFGVDVTDRIALTNLLVRDPGNYRSEDKFRSALETYGGPTIGIGFRLGDNITKLFDDDPQNNQRAIEGILPTAFSNIKKSSRNFTTGAYETTRGDPILADVTVGAAIKEAMGFRPAALRSAQDRLSRDRRVVSGIVDMRSALLDLYAFSHKNGDEVGKQETVKAIREFNQKHPEAGIDGDSIKQSLTTRARGSAIARLLGGNVADKRFIQMLLDSRAEYEDF